MKIIKGTTSANFALFDEVIKYFEYEINGKIFSLENEPYLNKEKNRYEHLHQNQKGKLYLIIWNIK